MATRQQQFLHCLVSLSREAESKAEAEISKVDLFQAQAKVDFIKEIVY